MTKFFYKAVWYRIR